ncbi:MAG: hypothetical protein QOI41_1937, partial [Myxococcales bacterium]|nr:hypothetical protein [Myxococcales bacterium]
LIVAAFQPLSGLSARHATYLVFQIMLAVALGMTLLYTLGGRARLAVMGSLALALLAESHHAIRALASPHYDSGLVTSLPMPVAGALLGAAVVRAAVARSSTPPISATAQQAEVHP